MTSVANDDQSRGFSVVSTALVVAFVLVSVGLAWITPLDVDELDNLHTVYLHSRGLSPLVDFLDHPFHQSYKWTMGFVLWLVGESSVLLYRLFSIAIGALALVAFAKTARRTLGNLGAIFAAVFLGASIPTLLRFLQIRSDAIVLLFLVLSLHFLTNATWRENLPSIVGAGAFAGLATALRISVAAYPLAVALVLLMGDTHRPLFQRARRAIVFSFATGLATVSFLAAPFDLATIFSIQKVFDVLTTVLLEEDALGAAGIWSFKKQGGVLMVLALLSVASFVLNPLVPREKKDHLVLRCLFVAAVIYCPLILRRSVCTWQDILFLLFFAAPFFGLMLERMYFFSGTVKKQRLGAGLVGLAFLVVVVDTTLFFGNVIYQANDFPQEKREMAYEHVLSGELEQSRPVEQLYEVFLHCARPGIDSNAKKTWRQVDATRRFFLAHSGPDDYCFSSDSSHLFRLNPPSFSPPTLAQHTVWNNDAIEHWISLVDRKCPLVQAEANKHGMLVWALNGQTPNERIRAEFEAKPPAVILLDRLFLQFMESYPALGEFVCENYQAIYVREAASFFALPRRQLSQTDLQ